MSDQQERVLTPMVMQAPSVDYQLTWPAVVPSIGMGSVKFDSDTVGSGNWGPPPLSGSIVNVEFGDNNLVAATGTVVLKLPPNCLLGVFFPRDVTITGLAVTGTTGSSDGLRTLTVVLDGVASTPLTVAAVPFNNTFSTPMVVPAGQIITVAYEGSAGVNYTSLSVVLRLTVP